MAEARQGEATCAHSVEDPRAVWIRWIVGTLQSPDGPEILSCAISTTEVNELLKAVHDRMPAVLERDAESTWLDPKTQESGRLLPLLRQYPPDEMEFYPVSREVNSPAVGKPNIIEPNKESV
jgi:putative SOS response-associated peptidase YedK